MKVSLEEDRFHRFRLIEWWDQDRLAGAKILVAGAGAIGNEVLKNLALLGVGRVFVADLDAIETSNLSRSVLFRETDVGRPKAEVAASRAREIYPPMRARGLRANVIHDLGLGLFRWADVVIGALDNREARLAINRAALRVSRPWIDGGIERLSGIARVFRPGAACYECTMNETDWKILEQRRSCSLLGRRMLQEGHVPTTPTTASIVAAIQCQEALKLLHGKETLDGGYLFDGMGHNSCLVRYPRKEDCMSHEPYEAVVETEFGASTPLGALLDRARRDLGEKAALEFPRELLQSFDCPKCGRSERVFRALSSVGEADAKCPCGGERAPRLFHSVNGRENFLDRTLEEIGVPRWDVVGARAGTRSVAYELAGDRAAVLGELA
jgi:adenylyltransferase/sulfurtransferase